MGALPAITSLGSRLAARIRVIVSQASPGLVLLLQLHCSSSFRVCRLLRPPSIWDTSVLLSFPVSNSPACVGQTELPPSYSPVVSAGTGATTACMVQLSYCDFRRVIPGTDQPMTSCEGTEKLSFSRRRCPAKVPWHTNIHNHVLFSCFHTPGTCELSPRRLG